VKKIIIKAIIVLGALYALNEYLGLGLISQPMKEALARNWFILAVVVALLLAAYSAHKIESRRVGHEEEEG